MSCVAIITARGGSKRIPRKNIKEFCGKPIIVYSIEAALESGIFDEVMVSTDDEDIADVAEKYGATVPFMRSKKASDDYATTVDVLEEVISEYKNIGKEFDRLCCIYPTAPFITSKILRDAYKCFEDSKSDALVPIVQFSFPPFRGFVLNEGLVSYKWPEYEKARSQDLEVLYHDAGQFYFSTVKSMVDNKTLVTNNTASFILDELQVQDIDNEMDWKLAELKFKLLKAEENV